MVELIGIQAKREQEQGGLVWYGCDWHGPLRVNELYHAQAVVIQSFRRSLCEAYLPLSYLPLK